MLPMLQLQHPCLTLAGTIEGTGQLYTNGQKWSCQWQGSLLSTATMLCLLRMPAVSCRAARQHAECRKDLTLACAGCSPKSEGSLADLASDLCKELVLQAPAPVLWYVPCACRANHSMASQGCSLRMLQIRALPHDCHCKYTHNDLCALTEVKLNPSTASRPSRMLATRTLPHPPSCVRLLISCAAALPPQFPWPPSQRLSWPRLILMHRQYLHPCRFMMQQALLSPQPLHGAQGPMLRAGAAAVVQVMQGARRASDAGSAKSAGALLFTLVLCLC